MESHETLDAVQEINQTLKELLEAILNLQETYLKNTLAENKSLMQITSPVTSFLAEEKELKEVEKKSPKKYKEQNAGLN